MTVRFDLARWLSPEPRARYCRVVRWLALLLVSGVVHAAPSKPVRKPAPPDLPSDRLSYFVDAVMADKKGDYDKAISRYRSADDGKKLPAIVYNIADLERRSEDYDDAIRDYKKYLELSPQAPDRAAVEQLIRELEKTPASLVIDGDDLDAVVFIDGKRIGPSPLVTSVGEGWHIVDRIGPDSYLHDTVDGKPMSQKHISGYGREDKGNVVLSTSSGYGGSWKDREFTYKMNQRFELPPGTYQTYFIEPNRACTPLKFTVPATGMVYVFIAAPRDFKRGECAPIKVMQHNLPFTEGSIRGAK